MPTIKTIKPAGGGDYTTLAAWWSARSSSGSADEWAECYGGGNLGSVVIGGGTSPDISNYVRIYAADRNDGINVTSGAYLSLTGTFGTGIVAAGKNYTRIEGLGIDDNYTSSGTAILLNTSNNCLIENCLIDGEDNGGVGVCGGIQVVNGNSTTIRNNVIRHYNATNSFGISQSEFSATRAIELENVTIHDCYYGIRMAAMGIE